MRRPRALDLFCCAGGMSEGLRRAGFEVTGVDIRDLAKYYRGGTFVQADALTFPLDGFDFIHASPPCQAHSGLRHLHPGREYPDLIEPVRERLKAWGGPYSIENVPGAPLKPWAFTLCGASFGLGADCRDGRFRPLRRHRRFECSIWGLEPPRCACQPREQKIGVYGEGGAWTPKRTRSDRGGYQGHPEERMAAMGIDWMPMKYLSQAIPPAYGEWIGRQALLALGAD